MTELQKRTTAFFSTLILGAVLAWLGGYNFDYRSAGVAVYCMCVLLFGFLMAACPMLEGKSKK